MPNHIMNEIRLHNTPLDVVASLCFRDDGAFTFTNLVPLPINHWSGDVGSDHETHFPGNWLQDARDFWGTKWDAYGKPKIFQDGDDVLITFETAWSPPRGWVVAVFNTLKCIITHIWLDEGRADAVLEEYVIDEHRGPRWSKFDIIAGQPAHLRLYKLYFGHDWDADQE